MADGEEWKPTKWMHIPCLPKPEYHLMQAMIRRYGCKDQSELITVLLRVVYDCIDDAQLVEALDAIRSLPVTERRYDLTLE